VSFLIDGYNFLFRIEGLKKSSLEKKREQFVDILNIELACFKTQVFIVFDSAKQERCYAQCAHFEHLDVLYAPKGQSADEYIIELIEISRTPKTWTVVTSDAGLARQCQHLGAMTVSIEDFICLIDKKSKTNCPRKTEYRDSPSEMERLLKAFEERLKDKR